MAGHDVETGPRPLVTSTRWMSNLTITKMLSVAFRRSSGSPKALSLVRKLPTQESEKIAPLTDAEMQRQDSLILFIVGGQPVKGSLATSCLWYLRYLRSKIHQHWHLLAPALAGLEDNSTGPASGDLIVVYDFVLAIAELFKNKKDLALVEIVDELDNRNCLKPQLDEERAIPNQIVFAALGWLCMLYEAVSHPKAGKLEVTKTSTNSSRYRNLLATKRYNIYRQGFDYIDLPLHSLLGKFGDLVPEAGVISTREPIYSRTPPARSTEVIMLQSICFNTLQKLAKLKIEWVTSLALHLELNSGKKTLKLFRFPSFCRMMAVESENNLMSRILSDHETMLCEYGRAPDINTKEFFEEILLSYRLIFGQDEHSYKAFSRMVPVLEGKRDRSSWETALDCDPLLHMLCGQSSTDEEPRTIYDEINANEPANYYNPDLDFPFFGKRLLELQQFVNQARPQTVRSLLNDRRDISSWYSLWINQVLVCFGTITILLMILSLVFQIWQVLLAKDQIRLAEQQLL